MENSDIVFNISSNVVILKILKSFEYATGLKVVILDKYGNEKITDKVHTHDCLFCKLINTEKKWEQKML